MFGRVLPPEHPPREVSFQHEQQHHVTEDDPGVVERDSPMVFAGVTVVGDWRQ